MIFTCLKCGSSVNTHVYLDWPATKAQGDEFAKAHKDCMPETARELVVRRTMDGPTDALVKAVRRFFEGRALLPPPRPEQVRESIDLLYLQLVHFDESRVSLEREPADEAEVPSL